MEVTSYNTMNTSNGLNARSPFLFSVIAVLVVCVMFVVESTVGCITLNGGDL